MASRPLIEFYTPEEYLQYERDAAIKHEYIAGEIVAMAGASRPHNLITLNVGSELRAQLKGRECEAYTSDMRVMIPSQRLYTYPDAVAWCGKPEWEDEVFDTLRNPSVIIEVLSPGTEACDRGQKFTYYRTIPSLQEYILLSQVEPHIDRYFLGEDGVWRLTDATGLDDQIEVASIGCVLLLNEVYDKVQFPEPDVEAEERGGIFRE